MQAQDRNANQLDAFILFNAGEANKVKELVDRLESYGISTYFWDRDISAGEEWNKVEDENLHRARVVLVFLGKAGWGPNHLRIAEEALTLNKRVIPILIGNADAGAMEAADGLFTARRYLDFRKPTDKLFERLATEIRKAEPQRESTRAAGGASVRLDELINTLLEGSEDQRADVIREIQTSRTLNRPALGERIRRQIKSMPPYAGQDYPPSSSESMERDYPNPSGESAAPRSWLLSALIWADPEHQESQGLFIDHIHVISEPVRPVRFWLLAGLYQRRASVLSQVVSIALEDDDGPEIRFLAQAIQDPRNPELIDAFKSYLQSTDSIDVWCVLRALRIIPIPELSDAVCNAFTEADTGSDEEYDALMALSTPPMAQAAAPRLRSIIVETVNSIVTICVDADRNVARQFAVLLVALEDPQVDKLLNDYAADNRTAVAARQLIGFVNDLRAPKNRKEISVAGYASDVVDPKDLDDSLDIQEDVQTLTAVMLAKEVKPPLAIGLFGDWGSGKSYFMESMIAAVNHRKGTESKTFTRNVCQIRFNAWHYADTNLWASLVSTILEDLASHVAPEASPEQQATAVLAELETAKAMKKEAEAARNAAEDQLTKRQEDLQKLQLLREQKQLELSDLKFADIELLFVEDEALKKNLEESLQEVGVNAVVDNVKDVSKAVSEANSTWNRAVGLFQSLFHRPIAWWVIGTLVLALIVLPLAGPPLLKLLQWSELYAWATTFFTQLGVAIGGLAIVLRKAIAGVKGGLEKVERAKAAIDKRLDEKRKTPLPKETELQEEITKLKVQEQEATSYITAATAKLVELEDRFRALNEARSLTRFLIERTHSDDYRKHLGLISTIRRDFDSLADRLKTPAEERIGDRLSVDRIILYIDDLDRCPEDKVMDVLQAVHLLLAYPLFVVVVGVDPRWLLHSLGTTYSAFQPKNGGKANGPKANGNKPNAKEEEHEEDEDVERSELWRTTPQNYLEKIFQIPFNLNRMTETGYGNLLGKLMGSRAPLDENQSKDGSTRSVGEEEKKSEDTQSSSGGGAAADATQSGGADVDVKKEQPPDTEANVDDKEKEIKKEEHGKADGEAAFVVKEEALTIQTWEIQFAEKLYFLIPTPRSAKRFSNIYRILKASVSGEKLQTFEGTETEPGTFQIPMLLLAMLIGAGEESVKLFPSLMEHCPNGETITGVIELLVADERDPKLERLGNKLRPIVESDDFPDEPDAYSEWLPRVARFSFDVGRAIQGVRSDASQPNEEPAEAAM